MKIKFKNKILDVKNESNSKKDFFAEWNGYTIEIFKTKEIWVLKKQDIQNNKKYEGICINPLGYWICDCITGEALKSVLQECFDNIAGDIDDMKSNYDELGQWLELVKEYL